MRKKDKRYCSNCGTLINKSIKKCLECKKKVNPFNNRVWYYIKDYVKGDIKGKVYNYIFEYFKKNAYSFILSLTIIAGITAPIIADNVSQNNKGVSYIEVQEEIKKYSSPSELFNALEKAINDKDSKLVNNMLYKNKNKEVYDKYLKENEPLIIGKGKVTYYINENIDNLGVANSFLEYGVDNNEGTFIFSERNELENDGFEVEEYFISMEYCGKEDVCESYENNILFSLLSYALLIKEDDSWYIYKIISGDNRMKWMIDYKGDTDKINDDVMGGIL